MALGYSPEHRALLWPPAWEQAANEEGWTLRIAANIVEVDLYPAVSSDNPIYHWLVMWLVLNAYVCGSRMHLTAWEFEYAANAEVYATGQVPGDSMIRVENIHTGEIRWVEANADDNDGWKR